MTVKKESNVKEHQQNYLLLLMKGQPCTVHCDSFFKYVKRKKKQQWMHGWRTVHCRIQMLSKSGTTCRVSFGTQAEEWLTI